MTLNRENSGVNGNRVYVSGNRVKSELNGFNAIPFSLKRGLVTAILVISVLAMFTASASAADYYVRTGGLDGALRSGLANNDATAWKTIQYAIDRAEVTAGDTIHVAAGDYSENVNVNKAHLTLQGEGRDVVTVTAASASDHVFEVTEDYVNISGFKVAGATNSWKAGIRLSDYVDHCNISDNSASGNYAGIFLRESSYNEIANNIANSNNLAGIRLDYVGSNNNILTGNTANENGDHGIYLFWGPIDNEITNNTANSNNDYGIYLYHEADGNNISCNWVAHNELGGLYLGDGSTGNTIEDNNIITNGVSQGGGIYHYQFYNDQDDVVDAKNNYWGTNDNNTIDASIFDNEEEKGTVTFLPKRDGESPCAPIPELATIILFSVGLLMLAGYARIGRRK